MLRMQREMMSRLAEISGFLSSNDRTDALNHLDVRE
jgi:hypothetical protein